MRLRRSLRLPAAFSLGAVVALGALAPGVALADPAPLDVRAARQLFADAEHDEDGGHWADALEKLRRVAAVKRTAGIRYHVALCEEHLGQLVAALEEYQGAADEARADGTTDVRPLTLQRITDLAQRVPHLTVRVGADAPSATVTLDGAALPAAKVGVGLLLDPGDHRVEATAPGHAPFSKTVTLHERDAVVLDVELARLAPLAGPAASPPGASPGSAAGSPASPPAPGPDAADAAPATTSAGTPAPSRTLAIATAAGAVALAGFGVAAFVVAGNAHASGKTVCAASESSSVCDGQKNTVRAWDFTAAAAWLVAAGGASLAVVLWTHTPASSASAQLLVGPGSLGVEGRF